MTAARRLGARRPGRVQGAEHGRLPAVTRGGQDDSLWVDEWLTTAALLGWSHAGVASLFLVHAPWDGAQPRD